MISLAEHQNIINELDATIFDREDRHLPLWASSIFLKFYLNKNGKKRGTWGEQYFRAQCKALGVNVESPESSEHDGIFNGIKIEIKTNGSSYGGSKMRINWAQIRPSQDYDLMICQVITPDKVYYFRFTPAEIQQLITQGKITGQHGGDHANSGTYILSGSKIPTWVLSYQVELSDIISGLDRS